MTVSIDPQEKWLYVATGDGWKKVVGMTCAINGLKCSAFFELTEDKGRFIAVSELSSGYSICNIPLNLLTALMCDTKAKALDLMRVKLEDLSKMLMDDKSITMDDIASEANAKLVEYVDKFGPMPPIEIMEDSKWDQ